MYEIDEEIKKNKAFIDAVVISGGEPFMQPRAVAGIAKYARTHSLFVAVQTNGFYPTVIESMLRQNLIDKIFLDIKAPLSDEERYDMIAEDLEEADAANCPYVIQQGRVELIPDNVIKEEDVFSMEDLKELAALAYVHLNDVRIRTRDGGEEVIYR